MAQAGVRLAVDCGTSTRTDVGRRRGAVVREGRTGASGGVSNGGAGQGPWHDGDRVLHLPPRGVAPTLGLGLAADRGGVGGRSGSSAVRAPFAGSTRYRVSVIIGSGGLAGGA